MIEVLRVTGAFGVKGAVRVRLLTNNFSNYKKIYDEDGLEYSFFGLRFLGGTKAALFLDGITNRAAAEALKGRNYYVKKVDLPAIGENEFYLCNLLGRKVLVHNSEKEYVIVDVKNFGAGDLIELSRGNEDTFLVPFTRKNFPGEDNPDSDGSLILSAEALGWFGNEQ
ncbi:MAG: ribosome maturation factor RimM [Holosporaceae bacterium]|jgi:16S rRNA processing protein RimM|nr:ribosome maturation factor RimM [Holosporaceae bacterium]